jgi:hypothetical protein
MQLAGMPQSVGSDFFSEAGKFYRVIVGQAAFDDIVESGQVRTNAEDKAKGAASLADKLKARPTAFPSFSKDQASMEYAAENPEHFIVVTTDESLAPSKAGRHGKGSTYFPTDAQGNHLKSMSAENAVVYRHDGNGQYSKVYEGANVGQSQDRTLQELDATTEPGTLAPESPVEDLPLEGENIPWQNESFSIAPQNLPEVFLPFTQEILDQIKSETDTVAAIHIDRMKVGEFAGIPLQGGMFYSSIIENLKAGVVWAFNAEGVARGVARRAAQNGGYVKLVLMQEGNVVGNKTFGTIWFKLLQESIAAKKISKAVALKELNRVRELYAVHPNSNLATGHTKAWKSIEEAQDAIVGMPQQKRGATYFQKSKTKTKAEGEKIAYQSLLAKKLTSMGFPDAIDIVANIEEPSFKGVPTGAVVGIIKFDALREDEKVQTATEAGVPEHISF